MYETNSYKGDDSKCQNEIKISLGTPTEELPEWTLSLDFTESQDTIKEEKKPESTISSESTFSEPSPQPAQPQFPVLVPDLVVA